MFLFTLMGLFGVSTGGGDGLIETGTLICSLPFSPNISDVSLLVKHCVFPTFLL